jgi:ParB-like chromosome segregation protein Spo0J
MKVRVDSLKHHPLNELVYKLSGLDELMDSIKEVGLLQPLTIDQYNQVISGNRRFECLRILGVDKVEVNKMNVKEKSIGLSKKHMLLSYQLELFTHLFLINTFMVSKLSESIFCLYFLQTVFFP